ncbi:NAD-dependent epimerase/dehydratase family protein [Candidatus Woesearchaeota archaeon]|nr:NAD-dependent epimerase/dehydratase family protein [Candidatus Woesearchaeota archaeon]
MKVFLTGGAGFIGSAIARKLLSQGEEVIIHDAFLSYIDPLESNYEKLLKLRLGDITADGKARIIRGDIRHKGRLLKILREHNPDAVIHLAALPISTVSNVFSEDAMGINLNGTVNVLEAVREVPSVKRFIFASSSMVYGDFTREPAEEDDPKNPIDVYGGTKLSGEILTKVFARQYGITYTIIRPSAVYGPTDVNRRVTQIFVENAFRGKPLVLHNGGLSKLDFTYVEDEADGFILALKSKKAENETFNITRGEGRTLKDMAEIIKKHIPETKIEYKEAPRDEKRPERGALSVAKAKTLLGYNPKFSLEEGMAAYIAFVKKSGIL